MEPTFQIIAKSDLADAVFIALRKFELEKEKKLNLKSLSVHQVAKKLGRADATIKKYVEQGLISTTKDGRIPEIELERFLDSEN